MASSYMGVQSHGFGGTQVHVIAYGMLEQSRTAMAKTCEDLHHRDALRSIDLNDRSPVCSNTFLENVRWMNF